MGESDFDDSELDTALDNVVVKTSTTTPSDEVPNLPTQEVTINKRKRDLLEKAARRELIKQEKAEEKELNKVARGYYSERQLTAVADARLMVTALGQEIATQMRDYKLFLTSATLPIRNCVSWVRHARRDTPLEYAVAAEGGPK